MLKSKRSMTGQMLPSMNGMRSIQGAAGKRTMRAKEGQQVTSYKLPGPRPISNANKGLIHRRQASSFKRQASSLTSPEPDATNRIIKEKL
jgi:hypothetical protein